MCCQDNGTTSMGHRGLCVGLGAQAHLWVTGKELEVRARSSVISLARGQGCLELSRQGLDSILAGAIHRLTSGLLCWIQHCEGRPQSTECTAGHREGVVLHRELRGRGTQARGLIPVSRAVEGPQGDH